MATLDQLKSALVNAHNAGDTAAAKMLAAEIVRQQGNSSAGMSPDLSASLPDVPLNAPQPEPVGNSSMWSTGNEGMDTVTMGGQSKLNALGGALVDSAFGAARGEGWNYWDNYNKLLQEQRDNQSAYNTENPGLTALGRAGGIALGVARGPAWGKGLEGAAKTGMAYGFMGGALQDANSIGERVDNAIKGTAAGGIIGGTGYGAGKALGWGVTKAGKAFSVLNAPPQTKAEMEVYDLIQKAGGPAVVKKKIAELGPDAVLADVLGMGGTATGRRAANVSPEARQILTDFVSARKEGQNVRLATDINTAARLPPRNIKTADVLKKEAYDKVRPVINKAYQLARKVGADVDLNEFDNIITTPVGNPAFKQALDNVTSRAARDPSAGGNLAVLDETKRILDGWAKKGFRDGDPMASEYAATAEALRTKLDSLLSGDEYAVARALRQDAYKGDAAFDLGAELGGSNVTLGLPQSVPKVLKQHKGKVAQGYAAAKVENLLNKNSTAGAYSSMITPQGRAAYRSALGSRNNIVDKALKREQQFNATNSEIVGNSTTTRQQIEQMVGYGVSTAAATQFLTGDIWSSGLAGLFGAVSRKGLPMIANKLVAKNQRLVAPFLAEILTKATLPTNRPIPPGFLEKFVTGGDQKLARTLNLIWLDSLQKNSPQTNLPQ